MRTALLLLCLLWSLVEVHSQTQYPYVSFIEGPMISLPNHAYVNLSLVSEEGSHSVRCHTDLDTCCSEAQGIHRGDWIPPGIYCQNCFVIMTKNCVVAMNLR